MTVDEKAAFVRLYEAKRSSGILQADFLKDAKQAGFLIPAQTFSGWLKQYGATGRVGVEHDRRGQPKLLSDDDLDIMKGWVLDSLSQREEIHLADYKSAVKRILGKTISISAASRALKKSKLTLHTACSKTTGFHDSDEHLVSSYWSWIDQKRRSKSFPTDLSSVCSLDFTFTSHRKHRRTSFSPIGAAQPRSKHMLPLYTNCIVTCLWGDGVNRTPSVLFTYNPNFRTDRSLTVLRRAHTHHLKNSLRKWRVSKKRVVYVGKQHKETRNCVREHADLLRRFFTIYKVLPHWVALSDNGHPFANNLLKTLGFKEHMIYPPEVHQYMSPNDNKLHGTAKASWCNSGIQMIDDVQSSICLLHALDVDTERHSRTWFSRNLFQATRESIRTEIYGEKSIESSEEFRQCMEKYRAAMHLDLISTENDVPQELTSTLDGEYHKLYRKKRRRTS